MAARAGHGNPRPDAPDVFGHDVVQALALDRDHPRRRRARGTRRGPAEIAEPLFAHREGHGDPAGSGSSIHTRAMTAVGVVAHPGADEFIVPRARTAAPCRVEHRVDVRHHEQLRLAVGEAPDQVADSVAMPPAPGTAESPLEPGQPLVLGAGGGGNGREGDELFDVDHAITAVASISTTHSGRASALTTSPVETG